MHRRQLEQLGDGQDIAVRRGPPGVNHNSVGGDMHRLGRIALGVSILLLAACNGGGSGEPAPTPTPALLAGNAIDAGSAEPRAQAILAAAARDPAVRRAELYPIAAAPTAALFAAPSGTPVALNLLGTRLQLTTEASERRDTGVTELYGKLGDGDGKPAGSAVLTLRDGQMTGTLFLSDRIIALHSIDPSLALARELVLTDFPGDERADFTDPIPNPSPPRERADQLPTATVTFSLLQLFTPEAEAKLRAEGVTLIQFADSAVASVNLSFRASGLDVRVASAGAQLLRGFTETARWDRDLATFLANPTAIAERKRLRADTLILNRLGGTPCGEVEDILASKNTARGVVRLKCAVENFSLAHELGHLLGACHDIDPNPAFPFGRGFVHVGVSRERSARTIMGYPDRCDGCSRQEIWSSPTTRFLRGAAGVSAGSASRDSARVVREGAPFVAEFGDLL